MYGGDTYSWRYTEVSGHIDALAALTLYLMDKMLSVGPRNHLDVVINPLALELDIYSLAHHLCKMWIFYEPRRITLGNTRHFVEE